MPSKNVRGASLRRALKSLEEELGRVNQMISLGQLPSPVAEKVLEGLLTQRKSLLVELAELEEK